ncbi:anaerobic ribonucleoside-triphosphate reductase [Aciduliprofundum boonei T469]|nr:anaerobic ribonucleoside-triphosphate reductase [Aciduliprofundum boonei T469]
MQVKDVVEGYVNRDDWRVQENSNTGYSFSGLMLHVAGHAIAEYTLRHIYPKDIADAHRKGYYHIHDLSFGIIPYCAGWYLKDLLLRGFGGVPGKINANPPKHLDTAVAQMVNFLGTMQMEFAGAQAFSSVDTYLAPFIRRDKLSYNEVKQNMQRLIYGLNIPSRWGSQTPFTNFTFDIVPPEDLGREHAVVGGKELSTTYDEYREEMDMLNRAFMEIMMEGDANGRIFTFPIPTYNLLPDFDWDSEIADLLFRMTAKYGTPYFQNYIGSDLDPRSIRAMCCRLQLDINELRSRGNGLFGSGELTGSIGVVTINMNRLGYESKDEDEFFEKLLHYMHLAKESLEIKREIVKENLRKGLLPFTKIYLGHFNNHFSTIGLIGMHEALMNLFGFGIYERDGLIFAIKTLRFMREVLRRFQDETGNLYNLEATPAEGSSYRLARLDKKMHPDIYVSGEDEPYLTNSTWLPADYKVSVIEALAHQEVLQTLYTGGTVFHTYLGEKVSSESVKSLAKKIAENTKIPYFTITPTFSICPEHGYLPGEQWSCPYCGRKTEVYSRVVGYFRPVEAWNGGKKEEFKMRINFNLNAMESRWKVYRDVAKNVAMPEVNIGSKEEKKVQLILM